MKLTVSGRLYIVLVLSAVLFSTACRDQRAPAGTDTATPDTALKRLQADAAIVFPTNTIMLSTSDRSGRGSASSFYVWGVFSPTAIPLPSMKAPGVRDHVVLPLEDTVRAVQEVMREQKISQAQSAFMSEWQTNGYTYRGTLVRCRQGDYLMIERFQEK